MYTRMSLDMCMKIILCFFFLLFRGGVLAQSDIDSQKKDSLNRVHYDQLKNTGDYDRSGLKTGYWIEYRLLFEPPSVVILDRFKGIDSLSTERNVTTLEKSEGEYLDGLKTNQWNSFEATYDEDDSLLWEIVSYSQYKDGKKHGPEKMFRLGALIRDATYHDGRLDGTELLHSPSGADLHLKAQWKEGIPASAVLHRSNGKVISTLDYTNYPLAKVVEYFNNGRVRSEYTVLGEQKVLHGDFVSYDENGKLQQKKQFKNGLEVKD
jgi:antitoxin component YwqK of YwqJK toxin-antitoxin module